MAKLTRRDVLDGALETARGLTNREGKPDPVLRAESILSLVNRSRDNAEQLSLIQEAETLISGNGQGKQRDTERISRILEDVRHRRCNVLVDEVRMRHRAYIEKSQTAEDVTEERTALDDAIQVAHTAILQLGNEKNRIPLLATLVDHMVE